MTVRVWNLKEKRQEVALDGHNSSVNASAISHDKKYVISGLGNPNDSTGDNTVRVWNLKEKRQDTIFKSYTDFVLSVGITYNSRYAVTGGKDYTFRVWYYRKIFKIH